MSDSKLKSTPEAHQEAQQLKALWDSREHPGQAVFGEEFGIGSQSAVGQFLRGERPLSLKAAIGFAKGLKCNISDFSPRLAQTISIAAEPSAEYRIGDNANEVLISQYSAYGAMGPGFTLEDHPPGFIKSWRVDKSWLKLNVPSYTSANNLCIVTGFGNSMKPRYNPGDPLLMDSGVTHVDHDGIFFFRVEQYGFIKQLQRIPSEHGMILRAKSFNPDYESFDIKSGMDFQVFGKILTVWRSEQF